MMRAYLVPCIRPFMAADDQTQAVGRQELRRHIRAKHSAAAAGLVDANAWFIDGVTPQHVTRHQVL